VHVSLYVRKRRVEEPVISISSLVSVGSVTSSSCFSLSTSSAGRTTFPFKLARTSGNVMAENQATADTEGTKHRPSRPTRSTERVLDAGIELSHRAHQPTTNRRCPLRKTAGIVSTSCSLWPVRTGRLASCQPLVEQPGFLAAAPLNGC